MLKLNANVIYKSSVQKKHFVGHTRLRPGGSGNSLAIWATGPSQQVLAKFFAWPSTSKFWALAQSWANFGQEEQPGQTCPSNGRFHLKILKKRGAKCMCYYTREAEEATDHIGSEKQDAEEEIERLRSGRGRPGCSSERECSCRKSPPPERGCSRRVPS